MAEIYANRIEFRPREVILTKKFYFVISLVTLVETISMDIRYTKTYFHYYLESTRFQRKPIFVSRHHSQINPIYPEIIEYFEVTGGN